FSSAWPFAGRHLVMAAIGEPRRRQLSSTTSSEAARSGQGVSPGQSDPVELRVCAEYHAHEGAEGDLTDGAADWGLSAGPHGSLLTSAHARKADLHPRPPQAAGRSRREQREY